MPWPRIATSLGLSVWSLIFCFNKAEHDPITGINVQSVCFCKPWICWNWGPIFNLMLWQQFLAWLGTGIQTIWWKLGNVFLTEYIDSWWLPKQHNMKSTGSYRTGPLSYPNVVRFRQWNYLVRLRKTLWFHLKWLHYIMLCNFKNVPDVSSVMSHTFQGLVRII